MGPINPLAQLLARVGGSDEAPASARPQQPRPAPYRPPPLVVGPGGVLPPPPPPPFPFPMGPGGIVEGPTRERTAEEIARDERYGRSVGEFGARAGQLARSSRFQPQFTQPDASEEALRRDFNGRPPFIPPWASTATATSRASAETGVPRLFLDSLVEHESGGNDDAKAPTTSATGSAQFTKGTWLRMMRQHGEAYGLPPDASEEDLLALRSNRNWAALMTAEYARENEQTMTRALRRPITQQEAYIGHFLGGDQAADLIAAAEARMGDARRFVSREAVASNPQVFYEGGRYEWRTGPNGRRYQHYMGGGRPRTAREVVERQGRNFSGAAFSEGAED